MIYPGFLKYLKTALLLMLTGSMLLAASGQQIVTQKQVHQEFSFNPYPDQRASDINQILLMIAEGSGKLRAFTRYQYKADLTIHLYLKQGSKYLLTIKPDKETVTGDIFYHDFSLEHVLIPDLADIQLKVTGLSDAVVFEDHIRALCIGEEDNTWFEFSFRYDGDMNDLRIEFVDYRFYYDDRMQDRMTKWNNALKSYYHAADQLELIYNQIAGLSVANPEKLLLDEFILCDAESAMAVIDYAPFHHWIDIRKNDPEEIFPFYEKLSERIALLRKDFNHAIAHIDSLYYEHGVMMLSDTLTQKDARKYFKSALAYNPFHVRSHIALARLDAAAGMKEMALDRLGAVIEQMYPAGKHKQHFNWITDSVLDLFYDEAQGLILERRFIESLAVLEHVSLFCDRAAAQMMCPPLFSMLERRTHLGIYESFLVVSRRALRDDNLSLAATYIQSAIEYQYTHSDQVREANDAMDLLVQVLTRYRIKYELAIILGQEEASTTYYLPARDIVDAHSEIHDHVSGQRDVAQLKLAVLNFAVLGYPVESISLLRQLKELDLDPAEVIYHQEVAGMHAAIHLREQESGKRSGELFRQYKLNDPWFRAFRASFVRHW